MMKIIISPAKKMKEQEHMDYQQYPLFLEKSEYLLEHLKKMSIHELKEMMKCNDKIAELNYHRFQSMKLKENLSCALFTYEGLQYQHMACGVFTDDEISYVENHLRILSGFYGLLRPLDGICCYRLEMQTKVDLECCDNLYDYWNEAIANELFKEDNLVLNLASKEYSKVIEPYLNENRKMITCHFKQKVGNKLVTKATEAKMARGEMVRFMATHQIEDIEEIKKFDLLKYEFSVEDSSEYDYVFVKK